MNLVGGQLGEEAPCPTGPHRPLGPSRSPGSSTRPCQCLLWVHLFRVLVGHLPCADGGHSSELTL